MPPPAPASKNTDVNERNSNSRAGISVSDYGQSAQSKASPRRRAWIPQAAVWTIALLGVCGVVGGLSLAIFTPNTPSAGASERMSRLLETGTALESEVAKTVRPAIQRTDMLTKDPEVAQLLSTSNAAGQTAWLNRAIINATEVDAIALFDSSGHISAINTQYADGKPISPARIQRILGLDFGAREIIQKCLRNGVNTSVLEFQTRCDITPALFDSTGLSVAYSVPVFNPKDGAKLGVISTRLRFDRLSNLIEGRVVAGGAAKVFFVTDAGGYFSETINAGTEPPPIPTTELRDIVRPLMSGSASQALTRRADKYAMVLPLKNFQTLEGGGIHALIIADERWLMQGARRDRLLHAAAAGLVGTLLLIVAGLIHASLAARRMRETANTANEANARFAAIVQSSADAIIGESLDGIILSWNAAAEQIFGYSASEAEGRRAEFMEPPDRCHEMAKLRTDAIENKRVDHVETQRVRKDGPAIDVSISLAVIKDSNGAAVGIAKIARDITRQKRAEHELRKAFDELERRVAERTGELSQTVIALESQMAERLQVEASLRESEERFRQLAENTNDVFWMTSLTGHQLIYVSPSYERVWGRTCQSIYQNPMEWMAAIAEEDRPKVLQAWAGLERDGKYEAEYRIQRPDGSQRWIRDRALPIRDQQGKFYRVAGIAEDITDRRLADQEIIEARNAAEHASRAKSEFLANMSHEIRTPLNGVIGMLELLLGTNLNDQQQRYSQLATASATSLTSLLNDILDLSKIEAGKLEMNNEDFDLQPVIEDAIEMLAQKAGKKELELTCRFKVNVPRLVRGDPDRIRQILVNLVNNAIKFTDTGRVTVCVSSQQTFEKKAMIRVDVQDTGIGIPANRIERLFKSFSQVDSSTSRKYGGTGLGLSICKQLAELMGGEIGVESEEGRGSTFWVTLNLDLQPDRQSGIGSAGIDPAIVRVLVVDDCPVQRDTLLQQIGGWNMHAETVDNCDQAFDLLIQSAHERHPFHVAIVAGDIPREAWSKLAANVRRTSALTGTALIMLVSLDNPLTDHELEQLGFNARINKPVRQSMLFDTISTAIASVSKSTISVEGAVPCASEPAGTVETPRFVGKSVLLVEDNIVNQLVAQEILARAGHRCNTVADGNQAVEAVFSHHYDLVLMDCQMPGMDGFEATRIIRERERSASSDEGSVRVPIIALTANALKGDRERCIEAGMDAYCPKPFKAKQLLAAIESALSKAQPAASADLPSPSAGRNLPATESIAESRQPSFDLESLLERCMNNVDVIRLILAKFEEQSIDQLRQLEQNLSEGNSEQIARLAHALKGAAGMASAQKCHVIAADLEQLARNCRTDQYGSCIESLREEFRRCVQEMPDVLASLSSQSRQVNPKPAEVS